MTTSSAFGATQGSRFETHTHRRLRLEMQISNRARIRHCSTREYTLPHRLSAEGIEILGHRLTQRLSEYEDLLLLGDNSIDAVSLAEA
ncbi:hypothetical protein E4U33_004388 [Claviceps sp. LM78 group G4]|nr:hypothetical protein E4U33_004388 [Claviceps sp. LM78 group G4]